MESGKGRMQELAGEQQKLAGKEIEWYALEVNQEILLKNTLVVMHAAQFEVGRISTQDTDTSGEEFVDRTN